MTGRLRQSVRAASANSHALLLLYVLLLRGFPKGYPIFHGDQWRQDREYTDSSFAEIGSARFFSWVYPKDFSKSVKRIFSVYKENLQSGGGAVMFAPPK